MQQDRTGNDTAAWCPGKQGGSAAEDHLLNEADEFNSPPCAQPVRLILMFLAFQMVTYSLQQSDHSPSLHATCACAVQAIPVPSQKSVVVSAGASVDGRSGEHTSPGSDPTSAAQACIKPLLSPGRQHPHQSRRCSRPQQLPGCQQPALCHPLA